MIIINLELFGLKCAGCSNTVKLTLEKYPGVKRADVDFLPSQAKVLCDDNIIPHDLIKYLEENSSYKAIVKTN